MIKFRTLLVSVFLIFTMLNISNISAQKQRSQVSITQSYMIKRMDSVKSILVVYKGDAIFTRMYAHLSKRLKLRFKKKFEIGFRYDLIESEKSRGELNWIPKKTNSKIDHDLLCKVTVYDLKIKTERYNPEKYHTYKIDIELIDAKTNELSEFAQLEVTSYSSIYNNNKAIVKLIDKIITE